uniref:Uncharacterized protein n=1 Tax=Oryza nivara TaxID=4536 RepID=A0A0E0H0Q6_ORYNI
MAAKRAQVVTNATCRNTNIVFASNDIVRKSDLKTDPDCPKPPKARKENVRNVQPATGHPTAYHPQSMTSGPDSNPSPQVIDYYDGILPPASTRGRSIPPITSRQQQQPRRSRTHL